MHRPPTLLSSSIFVCVCMCVYGEKERKQKRKGTVLIGTQKRVIVNIILEELHRQCQNGFMNLQPLILATYKKKIHGIVRGVCYHLHS